ncbi:SDR family NAD(P)-dependent oxidoreductase [Scytonema tolypothrichoides VB-61278]|nr:SDR family NAD(P)-dependent oxidoreductase [Scytonema tolypothrichoides VB-61278]
MDDISNKTAVLSTAKKELPDNITDKRIVEAAVLGYPLIDDCVVLVRKGKTSQPQLVAYLVAGGSFSLEKLQSHLQGVLPAAIVPKYYVMVSSLPLTEQGLVDEQALVNLEVIDSELVQQWEERVQSLPEVDQAAVVVQEHTEKIPPLYIKDVLPEWKVANDSTPHPTKIVPQASTQKSDSIAISHGEPLQLPTDALENLSQVLLTAAKEASERGIVYIHSDGSETIQSYQALLEEAQRLLAGLRKLGLEPQDKVILQLDRYQDFILAFWGCILGGFVPVPITIASNYNDESDSNVKKLQNACLVLNQPIVLTNGSIAPQIRNLSNQLNFENLQVETVEDLRSHDPDPNWHKSQPDDLALLLLTSGSTGMPKGVTLTHRNIISSVAGTSQMNHLTSQDISLNWLPLDHPGPLIRCVIRCIFLGCQQIHAPTAIVLQDILKWLDLIERYRVTTTWAPNFAFALLSERAVEIEKRRWDLSSVKSFLNTAEPIVPQTAQKVRELLSPHGLADNAMHSSWGMAETSSGVTSSEEYLLNTSIPEYAFFAELGSPIPGISLRIVNDNQEVVNEQTIGYVQVKGSTVTSGYYQNPALNQEVFTEDGWFNTGDLGFLHNGRLTITGRTKNIIIINGVNYYSHEIEQVVEAVAGVEVSYTAACSTRQVGSNTDELIVFFHTPISDNNRLRELLKQIRQRLVSKIGIRPAYLIPTKKEVIPKTSIGKIQHAQLKKSFEAGEFDSILKQVDILLENDKTLPDWFYRPIWRRKETVVLDTKPQTGLVLIFLDSLGLGEVLCTELGKLNQLCVSVEAGTEFAKLADNRYSIAPENPDHYRQLLELVSKELLPIEQILHLWTYDQYVGEIPDLEALEQAQQRGVYSLLFLVQALEQVQGSDTPVRLQVIASYSQATSREEKIAAERSPVLGVVKTIPQELTWLNCRHLDLPVQTSEINVAYILHELQVMDKEQEVAYRNGQRLVSRIEKVNFAKEEKQKLPFKEGGMYVVTGGLGGIGSEIAKYLLQHHQARLILVGRTPLPERSTWETHLQQGDKVSERIKTYLSLEQLGGEVTYEAVDICNLSQLQQVVERVCRSWQCQLNGVLHLAGTIETRLLLEETADSFAATLRPKVEGTWVLHKLIENQPNSVFITFSSVNGFFGRMSAGAYSAANRFLDSFSQSQQQNLGSLHYCFAWSMWDETGLSRNYQMKDLNRARGYSIISREQGLHSFLVGLHREPGYLLVGLDGSKQYIQQYREMQAYQTQKLCAYFTAETAVAIKQLQGLEVRNSFAAGRSADRFGTPSTCDFVQLEEMPLLPTGEIDREQLVTTERWKRSAAERVAPRNELERQIASIWQEVLNVSQVGISDNFFELGGHSLLAVKLFAQIEKKFGKKLPLASLLQSGTVEALANMLHSDEEKAVGDQVLIAALGDDKSGAPWSSLVPIQTNGSKPPFFCIHPLGGEILCYRPLALHLGADQPVYGLQPLGLDGKQPPLTRVEDMADHYIREIQTIQPNGPYHIGGYSFGGIVAYEMAQQLHSQGEKVNILAMLDTSRPGTETRLPFVLRVFEHINNIIQEGPSYLQHKLAGWSEWGTYHIRDKYRRLLEKSELLPEGDKHLDVMGANVQALEQYTFKAYPGQMTVFRTDDKNRDDAVGVKYDPQFGWGELVAGGVDVYHLPGSHLSFLDEPDVQVLAEQLKLCLEKAHAEELTSSQANANEYSRGELVSTSDENAFITVI